MNKLLLTFALLGALAPTLARAQEAPIVIEDAVPIPGDPDPQMAQVSVFVAGLKEPQGLALDYGRRDIIVCDYGAGEILQFNLEGKKTATLATDLKSPAQVVVNGDGRIVVSERKANRVVMLRDGQVFPIGGEVIEPMGLHPTNLWGIYSGVVETPEPLHLSRNESQTVYAVAHTTSKIYRLDKAEWKLVYAAPDEDGEVGRYGLRCLAAEGHTLFVSDEVNGNVLMMSPGGRMAEFASGFADPSGMAVRGDWLYVCDEGEGGRLWKVDKSGVKTLVAEKLGRPRNVLFLDDKTALVSDRDGRVLKLNWIG